MIAATKKLYRKGVTLIEVIFAMGVVLIGLLGLLSVLPLAGRRAQDAIGLSVSASVGDSALQELHSRHLLREGRLEDFATTYEVDYGGTPLGLRLLPTGSPPPPPIPFAGQGFCIDPLYVAQQQTAVDPVNHFNDALFPYYDLDHNPLTNATDPTPALPWPASQPRLQRVGVTAVPTATFTGRVEQSRAIVENPDDLIVTRPKDRSLNALLNGLASGTPGTNLGYGKRVPAGEFRWIATVSPLANNRHASISIVVMRNRDIERDFPHITPPALVTETDPKKNPTNERLAYVSDALGFSGGAGGVVTVAGSQAMVSKILVNDWIMLSRRVPRLPLGSGTIDVHRWFRVASAEIDRDILRTVTDGTISTLDTNLGCYLPTSSASSDSVWVRQLLLDGPDWDFGFANDPDDGSTPLATRYQDNTFATLVPDVVSVTERIIRIEDL